MKSTDAARSTAAPALELCDRARTASLLDYAELVDAVAVAASELDAGTIASPPRMAVPMGQDGVLLSMPAVASDLAIHKLVAVQPSNRQRALPTIHGLVTVCDASTGRPLCLLDGPELTGRRTAAVSMLAIRTLLPDPPTSVLLIGKGVQAQCHVQALAALYPRCTLWVRALDPASTAAWVAAMRVHGADIRACDGGSSVEREVVITLTTSRQVVYDEPARAGRLVIGVGAFKPEMAEIGSRTLAGSSIVVDDPAGARHEAGDLLQAGIDWGSVRSLGAALKCPPEAGRPYVFKSVGSAAWDMAAARVALRGLGLVAGAGSSAQG